MGLSKKKRPSTTANAGLKAGQALSKGVTFGGYTGWVAAPAKWNKNKIKPIIFKNSDKG